MSIYLRKLRSLTAPPAAAHLPPVSQRIPATRPAAEVHFANRRFAVSNRRAEHETFWLGLLADSAEFLRTVSVAGWEGLHPGAQHKIATAANAAAGRGRGRGAEQRRKRTARLLTDAALAAPAETVEFGRAHGVGFAVAYPPSAAVVWWSVSAPADILDQLESAALAAGILAEVVHASTYVSGLGTGAGDKPVPKFDNLAIPALADFRPRDGSAPDNPARVRATGPVKRVQAGVRRTDGERGPAAPERITTTVTKAPGKAAKLTTARPKRVLIPLTMLPLTAPPVRRATSLVPFYLTEKYRYLVRIERDRRS